MPRVIKLAEKSRGEVKAELQAFFKDEFGMKFIMGSAGPSHMRFKLQGPDLSFKLKKIEAELRARSSSMGIFISKVQGANFEISF